MRIDLKMYDVIMDAQMFLPQVTENKRTDPGQNQPAHVSKASFLPHGISCARFTSNPDSCPGFG